MMNGNLGSLKFIRKSLDNFSPCTQGVNDNHPVKMQYRLEAQGSHESLLRSLVSIHTNSVSIAVVLSFSHIIEKEDIVHTCTMAAKPPSRRKKPVRSWSFAAGQRVSGVFSHLVKKKDLVNIHIYIFFSVE